MTDTTAPTETAVEAAETIGLVVTHLKQFSTAVAHIKFEGQDEEQAVPLLTVSCTTLDTATAEWRELELSLPRATLHAFLIAIVNADSGFAYEEATGSENAAIAKATERLSGGDL